MQSSNDSGALKTVALMLIKYRIYYSMQACYNVIALKL